MAPSHDVMIDFYIEELRGVDYLYALDNLDSLCLALGRNGSISLMKRVSHEVLPSQVVFQWLKRLVPGSKLLEYAPADTFLIQVLFGSCLLGAREAFLREETMKILDYWLKTRGKEVDLKGLVMGCVNEFLKSERNEFEQVGLVEFIAKCLEFTENERWGMDVLAFLVDLHQNALDMNYQMVRLVLAKKFKYLYLVFSTKSELFMLGENLVNDQDGLVCATAFEECLGFLLTECVELEERLVLMEQGLVHEDWRVRVQCVKAMRGWISLNQNKDQEDVLKMIAKLLQSRLIATMPNSLVPSEQDFYVKREICETISQSVGLLGNSDLHTFKFCLMDLDGTVDTQSRLMFVKSFLSIFIFDLNMHRLGIVSLDELCERYDQEHDSKVKQYFTRELFAEALMGHLTEMEKIVLIKRIYSSLEPVGFQSKTSNSFDVSCWRSTQIAIECIPHAISLFPNENLNKWRVQAGGDFFIERCVTHPCAAVSQAMIDALPHVVTCLGDDWLGTCLIPKLKRLGEFTIKHRVHVSICKAFIALVCNRGDGESTTLIKSADEIAARALDHPSPAVCALGAKLISKVSSKLPLERREFFYLKLSHALALALVDDLTKRELEFASMVLAGTAQGGSFRSNSIVLVEDEEVGGDEDEETMTDFQLV